MHLRLAIGCVQLDFEGKDSVPPQVGEVRLNLRTGKAELFRMQPEVWGDFPKIRNELTGLNTTLLLPIAFHIALALADAENASHIAGCDARPSSDCKQRRLPCISPDQAADMHDLTCRRAQQIRLCVNGGRCQHGSQVHRHCQV